MDKASTSLLSMSSTRGHIPGCDSVGGPPPGAAPSSGAVGALRIYGHLPRCVLTQVSPHISTFRKPSSVFFISLCETHGKAFHPPSRTNWGQSLRGPRRRSLVCGICVRLVFGRCGLGAWVVAGLLRLSCPDVYLGQCWLTLCWLTLGGWVGLAFGRFQLSRSSGFGPPSSAAPSSTRR